MTRASDAAVIVILFTVVSGWVISFKMRRRIRKSLGRKATGEDLTSIDTWMKVKEEEEKSPIDPK